MNRVPPSELADGLFNEYIAHFAKLSSVKELSERYKGNPNFQETLFMKTLFAYQVGSVAVALSIFMPEHAAYVSEVTECLKKLVSAEMFRRWGYTEAESDEVVQQAVNNLARLVFTNPRADRGLSLTWASEWLRTVGVDEVNPGVLFEFSHDWKHNVIGLIDGTRDRILGR